jgi:hypothetical protein
VTSCQQCIKGRYSEEDGKASFATPWLTCHQSQYSDVLPT